MSRGFFGGGGLGGGKNPFAPKKSTGSNMMFSRKRNRSMKEMLDDKQTHKIKSHKEMLEDMMDEKMFSLDRKGNSFQLPGTQGNEDNRKFSKGYLQAMELAKQKRMKQKMKKREQGVKIQPKGFSGEFGGRIDAKGRIINNKGQVVLQVNLETGVITDSMGMKVGKYKPFSHNNDAKIEKLIDKYSRKPGFGKGTGMNLFSGDKE